MNKIALCPTLVSSILQVDLHAKLTHLLQPENDPHQAIRIATFATIQAAADGSIFDAINGHSWVTFRCRSIGGTFLVKRNGCLKILIVPADYPVVVARSSAVLYVKKFRQ